MPSDRDQDSDTDPIPLSDLAERVTHERTRSRPDRIWDEFDRPEHPDEGEIWTQLTHSGDVVTAIDDGVIGPGARGPPVSDRNLSGVGGLSVFGQIIHGYVTALVLFVALLLVTATATGIIAAHYWILSLPLFALGLVLLVPVIAWELDFWDPRELG